MDTSSPRGIATSPEVTTLRDELHMIAAQRESLLSFSTDAAKQKCAEMAEQMESLKHRINMAQQVAHRVKTFSQALQARSRRTQVANEAKVDAEKAVEDAWATADNSDEVHQQFRAHQKQMEQLLADATAEAETQREEEDNTSKAAADAAATALAQQLGSGSLPHVR